MRRRALVLLFVLFALSMLACKKKVPKPGDACTKEGDFVCGTNTSRVICTKGQYVEETCTECVQKKGFGSSSSFFAGCMARGFGAEGAACPAEGSVDCDGTTFVQCKGGTYHRYPCGGANACKRTASGIACDTSVAAVGDACNHEDNPACSSDRKTRLHCAKGKMVADRTCKGPKSCGITPNGDDFSIECDLTNGDVGDICQESYFACSTDNTTLVQCHGGKYSAVAHCRGTDPHCVKDGDRVRCADPGIAEVGDPCDTGGACSPDGKALLECQGGAFKSKTKCRSCKVNGEDITCKH